MARFLQIFQQIHPITWLILGLLIRLLYAALIWDKLLLVDAGGYYADALKLANGEAYPPFWPPGLPLWLAAWMTLIGQNPLAAVIAMMSLHLLLSWLLYRLALHLYNRETAGLSLLVVAVYPAFVHHSVVPLTHLMAMCALVGLAYCWLLLARYKWLAFVSGIPLGILILTRPSSLVLLPIGLLWAAWRGGNVSWALTVVLAPCLMIGAWQLHIADTSKELILINEANSRNLFIGNNPYTPLYKTWWYGSHPAENTPFDSLQQQVILSPSHPYLKYTLQYIQKRPDLFLVRSFNRVRAFFAFDTFTGATFIQDYQKNKLLGLGMIALDAICYIGLLGLFVCALFIQPPPKTFILFMLVYAAPYFLAFSHPTYHLPIMPFMLLPAIHQLSKGLHIQSLGRKKRTFLWLFLGGMMLIQLEWIAVILGYLWP